MKYDVHKREPGSCMLGSQWYQFSGNENGGKKFGVSRQADRQNKLTDNLKFNFMLMVNSKFLSEEEDVVIHKKCFFFIW